MSLSDFIKQAESQQRQLKQSVATSRIRDDGRMVRFAGVSLHPEMSFDGFSNNEIALFHSCVHTVFVNNRHRKDELGSIHQKLVHEMRGRALQHFAIDKLDVTTNEY